MSGRSSSAAGAGATASAASTAAASTAAAASSKSRRSNLSLLVLSIISILLGFVVFYLTFQALDAPSFQAKAAHCPTDPPAILEIPDVDGFLCVVIQFFKEAASTPEGVFITATTLTVAMVVFFIFGLEGVREGSIGLLVFPALFGGLGQILGLGAVALVLFAPSLLLSFSFAGKSLRRIPSVGYQVVFSLTLIFAGFCIVYLQFPFDSEAFTVGTIIFQFAPLIYLLSTFFRFIFASSYAKPSQIYGGYAFLAGLGFALHYITLTQVFLKAGVFTPPAEEVKSVEDYFRFLVSVISGLDFTLPAIRFLIIDIAAFMVGPILSAIPDTDLTFSKIVFLFFDSIFLSPAAALAYFYADRELKLAQSTQQIHENKVKKN